MKPREMLPFIVCTAIASLIATYATRAVDATLPRVARLGNKAVHVFWERHCIDVLIFLLIALAGAIPLGVGEVFIALGVPASLLMAEGLVVVSGLVLFVSADRLLRLFDKLER